jgi:hypothetical protein
MYKAKRNMKIRKQTGMEETTRETCVDGRKMFNNCL